MSIPLALIQAARAANFQGDYEQPPHLFLAEKLPDSPELHRQVVLPGAMRAIHMDALDEYQSRGLDHHQITQDVNETMMTVLAPVYEQGRAWKKNVDAELSAKRERAARRQARWLAEQAREDAGD